MASVDNESVREARLGNDLQERVLSKLGFSKPPEISLSGLSKLYEAWCGSVPFDNSRKLIHVNSNDPSALPGDDAVDYLEYWLKHGTGGTCWAGNGALFALLHSLGFSACRGVATMLVAPDIPPNHGTVIVDLDSKKYMVDASILTVNPLVLPEADSDNNSENTPFSPWVKRVYRKDSLFHVLWRPLHRWSEIDCRVDYFPSTQSDFSERHEKTRSWSPFNFELNMRRIKDNVVIGTAEGVRAELSDTDVLRTEFNNKDERNAFLIEEMMLSEEHVRMIPPDRPTPPPPGSRTAAENARKQTD